MMQRLLATYGKKAIITVLTMIVSVVLMLLNKKFGLDLKVEEVLAPASGGIAYTVMQAIADAFTKGATSSVAAANVKAISESVPPPSNAPPSN